MQNRTSSTRKVTYDIPKKPNSAPLTPSGKNFVTASGARPRIMADQNITLDFDLSRDRRKKLATHHSNALYTATITRFERL